MDHYVWKHALKGVSEDGAKVVHYLQRGAEWNAERMRDVIDDTVSKICCHCGAANQTARHAVWECTAFHTVRCDVAPEFEGLDTTCIPEHILKGIPQAMQLGAGRTFWGRVGRELEPEAGGHVRYPARCTQILKRRRALEAGSARRRKHEEFP